jgi:uncharacterized protein (TIGR00255 family)
MVQSMTGFGAAEHGGFRVEIRSLNHRFMECFTKLPPHLTRHEMAVRERLKKRFSRGKFDVYVSFAGEGPLVFHVNKPMVERLLAALRELRDEFLVEGEITMDTLLQWKEFFLTEEAVYDEKVLFEAVQEAAGELEEMRLREGKALAAEALGRLDALEGLNEAVKALAPEVRQKERERASASLRELLNSTARVDEARLLQEASALAEKGDFAEEVARLSSHIAQMRTILREGGTIGRRLDFLLQEMHREANTVASKAGDARVLRLVVDMKAEIERTREQVQNIQ